MTRIAIGQFMEESITFVRQRADLEHFRNNQLLSGRDVLEKLRGTRAEVGGFLAVLEPAGVEVVPTVAANCVSSGPVPRATFDAITGDLLARLAAAGPVDGVLLALHGSMVLDDDPDGEGALLAAVWKQVGPGVPVVATLDLHAYLTARMVDEADALVGYDTYPHVDLYETGVKAANLLLRTLRGEVRPVTLLARHRRGLGANRLLRHDARCFTGNAEQAAGIRGDAKRLHGRAARTRRARARVASEHDARRRHACRARLVPRQSPLTTRRPLTPFARPSPTPRAPRTRGRCAPPGCRR